MKMKCLILVLAGLTCVMTGGCAHRHAASADLPTVSMGGPSTMTAGGSDGAR